MTLNRIAFCIVASFALLASACNSMGSSKGTKTEHGFRFINHTNNPAIRPNPATPW